MTRTVAFMVGVQKVLAQGGKVQFHWDVCEAYLVDEDGKFPILIDGRTYQGFLSNQALQATLTKTEMGTTKKKDLVIEWRKK